MQLGDEASRSDRVIRGAVRLIGADAYDFSTDGLGWSVGGEIPIWAPGSFFNEWKYPDLNDGAGGKYIRPYMKKDPSVGPAIEVGVVRGNSSSVQPPSGWRKADGRDLNVGAGGDYIYFCVKNR